MTRFNTGNPIDSSDPRDLSDNAKNLDQAVNTDNDTFTDRLGNLRPTLKSAIDPTGLASAAASSAQQASNSASQAETARDAAFVNADVYEDTAAGLAGTSDGDQFQVVDGDEIVRYRNDSGSAVEVARIKSEQFFRGMIRTDSNIEHAVIDDGGVILSGYDQSGSLLTASHKPTPDVEVTSVQSEKYIHSFSDPDGVVVAGLRRDGAFSAQKLGAGLHEIAPDNHPVYQWFIADRDGVIVCGLTKEGEFFPGGAESGSPASSHNVLASWVEPWIDPSENLMLSWVSTSESATVAEYRIPGASSWSAVSSQRTRAFPALDGLYIHTATLQSLSFATVYECRWPGASLSETFRTSPRSNPKIAMISDFQSGMFSDNVPMAVLGRDMTERGVDILTIPGDHVNDDGRITESFSTRWLNYLILIQAHFRSSGAMVPMNMLIGNHEGSNSEGENNAEDGGDGILGQIADIMSWSYWDQHPTRFVNSAAWFSVGNDLFFISLETDHTEPLAPQLEWLETTLQNKSSDYNRIMVQGHAPAFYPPSGPRQTTTARILRNEMYPMLEPYADKIVCYGCGHAHVICLTPQLRMMIDEELSDTENDTRYIEDPLGIVQIGTGPCQANVRNVERGDDVSSIDGTRMFAAVAGIDDGEIDVRGEGVENTTLDDLKHYWILDLSNGGFVATCYGEHSLPYLTYDADD